MADEDDNDVGAFGRVTQATDANAFWNSTGYRIWNILMEIQGFAWDNIGLSDLYGGSSLVMLACFKDRNRTHPAISEHTKAPFALNTIIRCLNTAVEKLKVRFNPEILATHGVNAPELFPEADLVTLRAAIKSNHGIVHMQGNEDNSILRDVYPLPPEHTDATRLMPNIDFQGDLREESRQIDMTFIARKMFKASRLEELLQLMLTFNCIGRAGE
ncbi:MAG: hypothetical protein SGARI_006955, partial [Bacillariaceae sp.]